MARRAGAAYDPRVQPPAGPDAIVLGLYFVCTVIVMYPLVLHSHTAIPQGGDAWQHYWNLWWVKTALLERHANPYFMPDIYFPYGATLSR